MNGKTTLPTKAWKTEYAELTDKRKTLNHRYAALKDEVREAEQIRKNVYSILRQEQREQQTHRAAGYGIVNEQGGGQVKTARRIDVMCYISL